MSEITNCPRCNALFMKNKFRDVCEKCYKEDEKMYETVYQFLRKRENRAATMETIMEKTGVEEELLYKWVKKGRIQTKLFPNLGYPCDKCGKIINNGKLCQGCADSLKRDLQQFEANNEWKEKMKEQRTYYTTRDK
ncbi:TIGR03826 family flagellar region protein [Rossellomorea oryzaecorticis]|uniref:TIGR03826 family flagellar region protein n=1 Tax=Rossellomorea oryzaecorticis TaxID=1396505 RepID=A0ABW8VN76_9BACI